jgi:hypothetical protein
MRRALLAALAVALAAAPAAAAKLRLGLAVSDATPTVGQPVTVILTAEKRLGFDLKLVAVAPRADWFDVVGTITGDTSRNHRARIPRDGFAVPVVRTAGNRWRARVRFPRPGRWTLVIPNEAPDGIMIPPPVTRVVRVR